MTIEAIKNFANALRGDEEMGRGLIAAIGQKQGGDAVEAFAAYAQEQGFAVTPEDAAALQSSAEGTLSDAELDGVAGGFSFQTIMDFSVRDILSGGVTLAKSLVGQEQVAEKWRI